jgi:hypothetical protein
LKEAVIESLKKARVEQAVIAELDMFSSQGCEDSTLAPKLDY